MSSCSEYLSKNGATLSPSYLIMRKQGSNRILLSRYWTNVLFYFAFCQKAFHETIGIPFLDSASQTTHSLICHVVVTCIFIIPNYWQNIYCRVHFCRIHFCHLYMYQELISCMLYIQWTRTMKSVYKIKGQCTCLPIKVASSPPYGHHLLNLDIKLT